MKMSLGYIGYGRYKEENEGNLLFEYSGENWNVPHNEGDRFLYDGLISIDKSILNEENWGKAIEEGRIQVIRECKNAFYRWEMKFDYLALRIIIHIFNEYKEKGEVPEEVCFIQ
jgi:hypothetical protein